MTRLLDVNCLIALAWSNHIHHDLVAAWFEEAARIDWATTPAIQNGFVRISMNPAVTGTPVSFPVATTVLKQFLAIGNHRTIESVPGPTSWPLWLATRLQGHRQIADASLLACSVVNDLVLSTLDGGILDLVDRDHRDLVEVIPI
ncbi:MAG: TA system VapC family ribonuclease toxin [Spirochaetales bacterium]